VISPATGFSPQATRTPHVTFFGVYNQNSGATLSVLESLHSSLPRFAALEIRDHFIDCGNLVLEPPLRPFECLDPLFAGVKNWRPLQGPSHVKLENNLKHSENGLKSAWYMMSPSIIVKQAPATQGRALNR
jgi:hypothetical protein